MPKTALIATLTLLSCAWGAVSLTACGSSGDDGSGPIQLGPSASSDTDPGGQGSGSNQGDAHVDPGRADTGPVDCTPACAGKVCGDDGCGGSCGTCLAEAPFCSEGACTATGPQCGDGPCDAGETCTTCPSDCGACTVCGDGTCDAGETCSACASDCGACIVCGDGTCNGGEDCGTCASDCGACPPEGACTNAADQDVLASTDVGAIATDQALGCLGTGDLYFCIVDGLVEAGLSPACAECYAATVACTLSQCLGQCASDPGGEACQACQDDYCNPEFEECSGLY